MDIQALLKHSACVCGREHSCSIQAVYVEQDALSHLPQLCADYDNILIVADENTYGVSKDKLEKYLADKAVRKVIFSGKTVLIPNEDAIETVRAAMCGIDLILGVGSGVIQDLCKCVSHYEKIPYMIVATAPSMDGYASNGAAMILGGMKETVSAGLPLAIVADTEILKNAPLDMLQAGYGDIVGKYSALCDWELSHIVNGEYLCPFIYDTTYQAILETLPRAKGILERDEESIRILMEALVGVGVMMRFAGSSRPASGSEHHLSHYFEITGIVKDRPYFPHGIDVAYSTVITAKIREKLLNTDFPTVQYRPTEKTLSAKLAAIYGPVADGCMALQEKVGNYAKDRTATYKENEAAIKEVLAEMPSAQEIEAILADIGLNMAEFYNLYSEETLRDAVLYTKDLKDRYTVLWLNYDLLGDPRGADI